MFSEYTYENLLAEAIANAPKGIDTRPGSIFYDAISAPLMRIAMLYADISYIADLVSIDTATGEYLDLKASEHSVARLQATECCYFVSFEGTTPEVGERFFADGIYFVLRKTGENVLYLEAEIAGTAANGIYSGTPAIPVNNISGLVSATFGEVMEIGSDAETDVSLRERLQEKISGPAENGNKQHYRTWCEEEDGVGRARIIPLWNGPNTVKGIIIDTDGTPAEATVIQRIQAKIDPDNDGDGEGDGLGEGYANLGAHFTAVAPETCVVNIDIDAELASGATALQAADEVRAAVVAYLKKLTLNTPDDVPIIVRRSEIGALITGLPTIIDYTLLTLNGNTANIEPGTEAVAIVGEVNVNV